jgi:protein-S-isoprenylcysteine O-methyltransferase Ste14
MNDFLAVTAVFPAVATIWFAIFWLGFAFWRRHIVLTATAALIVIGGWLIAELVELDQLWRGDLAMPIAAQIVGWAIVAASFVLGVVADRQIGLRVRSFLPYFEDQGHIALVTSGAYGVVRHPIYASGIYFQIGVFLITGAPSVAIACVVLAAGAAWFTRQEERRLVALLDDPSSYDRYRREVPAVFPRMMRRWPTTADRATKRDR